jgi:hypothetical protein
VLNARLAAGVKVATAPEQLTVPATGVVPGPVTVNVAAGDASVEQVIASLKVAAERLGDEHTRGCIRLGPWLSP